MNCEKIESVTSHNLYPPSPVTNCHTFSDPLPPLERDILYGRPLRRLVPKNKLKVLSTIINRNGDCEVYTYSRKELLLNFLLNECQCF